MYGLCVLAALTVWKTSSAPSALTLSISDIQVMNTPLRDIPSLKNHKGTKRIEHKGNRRVYNLLTSAYTHIMADVVEAHATAADFLWGI